MDKFTNIDYLKANNQRLYYFGLGFIQLVLNKYERVHFYNTNLIATNDEIHNHRYNFESTVLKGELENKKWNLISGNDYILTNESCNKDKELTNKISIEVGVDIIESKTIWFDESYNMFYNEFHSVSYNRNTITYLKRGDIITDYAQVIYKKDSIPTCPFSTVYNDHKLWELIEDTIKN